MDCKDSKTWNIWLWWNKEDKRGKYLQKDVWISAHTRYTDIHTLITHPNFKTRHKIKTLTSVRNILHTQTHKSLTQLIGANIVDYDSQVADPLSIENLVSEGAVVPPHHGNPRPIILGGIGTGGANRQFASIWRVHSYGHTLLYEKKGKENITI